MYMHICVFVFACFSLWVKMHHNVSEFWSVLVSWQLAPAEVFQNWPESSYHPIHNNCTTFAEKLLDPKKWADNTGRCFCCW